MITAAFALVSWWLPYIDLTWMTYMITLTLDPLLLWTAVEDGNRGLG